jgi:hypothetical protein
MNSDILIKLKPIIERLNIKQRAILNQYLSDSRYLLGEKDGKVVIRDIDGDVYSLYEFIKSKCNCG